MQDNKLPQLDKKELDALLNLEFFTIKKGILDKTVQLLSSLEKELKEESKKKLSIIPDGVLTFDSKISKGENYKGLPYLVLDYPRCFKTENIFAFRSMFWWGNYFTFALHLSGTFLENNIPHLKVNLKNQNLGNTFISIGDNQWAHHINENNYMSIEAWKNASIQKQYFENIKYLKLVRKLEISKWENAIEYGLDTFKLFLKVIS